MSGSTRSGSGSTLLDQDLSGSTRSGSGFVRKYPFGIRICPEVLARDQDLSGSTRLRSGSTLLDQELSGSTRSVSGLIRNHLLVPKQIRGAGKKHTVDSESGYYTFPLMKTGKQAVHLHLNFCEHLCIEL